jgi:hypothetical protein
VNDYVAILAAIRKGRKNPKWETKCQISSLDR